MDSPELRIDRGQTYPESTQRWRGAFMNIHNQKKGLILLVGIVCIIFSSFILHSQSFDKLRTSFSTLNSQLFSQPDQSTPPLTPNPKPLSPAIVYGYLPYWTRSSARFPGPLTHVSYFSLGIQADGRLLDLSTKEQEAGYRAYKAGVLNNLRTELPEGKKLELTITMMDQDAIPLFINSPEARARFVQDIKTIASTSPITGINIDIEYNGLVDDAIQENFAMLMKETRAVLQEQRPSKSLSIASYSDAGTIKRLTDLGRVEPYVDHIIMMAYDYHRRISPQAGPNSPLYGKKEGKWESDILSDLSDITKSVPPEKILLGIPFYGYQWEIEDPNNPNSFTIPRSGSTVTYEHIVPLKSGPGVTRFFDPLAFSPYLRFEKRGKPIVLYYDDPESLSYKISLARSAGLGGIAIWALGYEGYTNELWDVIAGK